ncbi:MAG: DUF5615 family PIN-like protein [Chitinophagales bacterium]|nr:DUF5615 family PIN-like protein [Chitinophagales bacterium]
MMQLLFDQNISSRIIARIVHLFPGAVHVKTLNLTDVSDSKIFMFARLNNIDAIVSQDQDFNLLQLEHGIPPKIIWIKTGNCSTATLTNVLIRNHQDILNFLADNTLDCLEIYG